MKLKKLFLIIGIMFTLCIAFGITANAGRYDGGRCGEDATWLLDTSTGILTISGTGVIENGGWNLHKSIIWYIKFNDSVTSISDRTFYGLSELTTIYLPESVTNIGNKAFYGCSRLSSITIPQNVANIGDEAFSGCNLSSIYVDENNQYYVSQDGVLYDKAIQELLKCSRDENRVSFIIPDSVTSISNSAFSGCTGLTSVTIGENVTRIGVSAFSGCTGLTEIKWNAKNVGDFSSSNSVFYNAGKNSEGINVIFGDSVEHIPAYLFYPYNSSSYAPKITSVTIGDSVTSIGNYAFSGCSNHIILCQ